MARLKVNHDGGRVLGMNTDGEIERARSRGHVNVDLAATHQPQCRFRRAVICSVGIECEHGYDVCPACDPCTCGPRLGATPIALRETTL